MSTESKKEIVLEIAHVLFIDIVGYSKLSINEQNAAVEELTQVVRGSEQFQKAEAADRLLKIATGDGMALVFYTSPEAPAQCAVEISRALKEHPRLQLRMGIHSGPVSGVVDVNNRPNLAGAGLNMAQRVMDCGDAGHILLSKHVAEDLEEYERWRPLLHELGTCEVKHGGRVGVTNLYSDEIGNPQLPKKFVTLKKHRSHVRWAEAAIGFLVLAAIVAAFIFLLRKPTRTVLNTAEKSIAVLPFENLSEDKGNAYFAEGIQNEILTRLSKIADLKVISRTSTQHYKSAPENLPEVARQLGVAHILEGSVQKSGDTVRVNVQLIKAANDSHLWADTFDRRLTDILSLESEMAKAIAEQLRAKLTGQEEQVIAAKPTDNTEAYDAYLHGRAFAGGPPLDKSTVEGAIHSYQEAVKLDPNFGLAWARLSSAQSSSYWLGHDPSPARLAAAKDSADRAFALDPNLAETHLALGYYRYYGQRDFTGGLAEFQQAEKSLPNDVDVVEAIAFIQRRLGHWDEAIAGLHRVIELDPRNINAYNVLAVTYSALRRFPEALAMVDRILALEPTNTDALGLKAYVFCATGDLQAVEPLLANPGTEPQAPGGRWPVRGVQALFQRRYAAAIEMFSNAVSAKTKRGEPSDDNKFLLGLSQQRAGDVAAARATYEKAAQDIQRELEKVAPGSKTEAQLHSGLGLAYAGLGEAASAIAEGQKAMAMDPSSKDSMDGPAQEAGMAQIYALLGDADHAIPILKRLQQMPYAWAITPALLRLDPGWDPIRNDPRFQKLCEEKPKTPDK